ncbi:bacterioferritin-associated ferredoxin [Marinicella sediminis]|uniref:Bacterioferritin-associated ferredoxin n=1 Tax=Marinicella sediminis TaxID=1792834 RepID=A0ABV7J8B4_9GAMM|nr:(2Fe-2S)-binding protein [Marinicella sediminis]
MYVCICHGVTDKDIKAAAGKGARSIQELQQMTGCATGCGGCLENAEQVLQAQLAGHTPDFLQLFNPASRVEEDWQLPA